MLETSGSTSGTPRVVALSAAAIRASATATHETLGGPGAWLLTLPAHHVAGVMVAARAILAGTPPTLANPGPFRAETFADDVARFVRSNAGRRYTSLVPTQLRRLLASEAGTAAAATFDAILVGGAATPPDLLEQAREAGIAVVTTYGMTETSGGCVYDGVPLRKVGVRIDDDGRIHLSGPTLALGYLSAQEFNPIHGELATSDRGTWDGSRLRILGRIDDVLLSGGINIHPLDIEAVLARVIGVAEVVVVGVSDPEWGEVAAAAVVPHDQAALIPGPVREALITAVQEAARAELGAPWVPRRIAMFEALPLLGPGKPDRRAVQHALSLPRPGA